MSLSKSESRGLVAGTSNSGFNLGTNAINPKQNAVKEIAELGINTEKPKHPQFAVKSVREGTFKGWPEYVIQTPHDMAEAGFFYSGKDDNVFCFYCGQGLHSWEPEDVPWEEHAKWSPGCVFLHNVKGREFIEWVKHKQTHPELKISNQFSCQTTFAGISCFPHNSPAVQSLELNGYKREEIEKAVTVWNKMKGNTDFSASDILQVIFELEEGNIKYEDYIPHPQPQPSGSVIDVDDYKSQLRQENQTLKAALYCKICKQEQVCVAFLPCGHVTTCESCAPAVKYCTSCNKFVKGTIRTYLA
ncbi:hypothetical protein FSP39_015638 [Pinctada imbricata]|uniref:RING-type domain-containing protein n=1 Tax=Pinctada imbricata TaxID=66713 RepID=A0AA89BXI9_PINIB|nr:hypothetical protein FSP39_015638 [Pinctada imbricata]